MDELMDGKPFLNDRTGVSVSKIRDILRRQRQESDGGAGDDVSDLDFVYDDADSYSNEISELYSYTEAPEFRENLNAFETLLYMWGFEPRWQGLTTSTQESVILRLLNFLDMTDKSARVDSARAILYIAQVRVRDSILKFPFPIPCRVSHNELSLGLILGVLERGCIGPGAANMDKAQRRSFSKEWSIPGNRRST